jgi:Galactose oxidase, central domain
MSPIIAAFRVITLAALALTALAPGALAQSRFDRFPSAPGPQIELIRKLPEGVWLDLGPPAPDPKWGSARGRSWAASLPVADSLGLAFFIGEGQHGWVDEKTGRYMDDFWAYDILAHRWMNISPGTDVRNPPQLILNQDGFPALANGTPVPIAILGHVYQQAAWDPDRMSLLVVETREDFYQDIMPSVYAFMQANKDDLNDDNASPWIYDVKADRWRRYRTVARSPETGPGGVTIYIPSVKKAFYWRHDEVWLYDPAAKTWQNMKPGGPKPPFGIDATACYDPKRDRIYLGGGDYPPAKGPNALWIYDIRTNSWIDPMPKGSPGGTLYGTDTSELHYDSASDTVLLFRHGDDAKGIFAYSPARNEWTTVSTRLPSPFYRDYGTGGSSGFYDPALNAHFVFLAGDSGDNGTMFVYRYKAAN